jgi:hypothetical protein
MLALVSLVTVVVGGTATAPTASACLGGTSFEYAAKHARGGILRARVAHVIEHWNGTSDLSLVDTRVIRGDPAFETPLLAGAGYVCTGSADAGDVVLIMFDVRSRYRSDRPLYYVIHGRGALSEREVDAGLGRPPATDARTVPIEPVRPAGSGGVAWLAAAWILGLVVAARRLGRR